MFVSRRSVVVLALASAGLLAAASPVQAFWPKGYTYRQRVVVRGPGPFLAPGVGVYAGPVARGEVFRVGYGLREFAPFLGESYFVGDSRSDLKETIRAAVSEVAKQELGKATAEATRVAKGSGAGTDGAATTPSSTCQELVKRVDKLEDDLKRLSAKVTTIDAKVTQLLQKEEQEQQAKWFQEQQAKLLRDAVAEFNKINKAQNAKLIPILEELSKKERDEAKIRELIKKLDQ